MNYAELGDTNLNEQIKIVLALAKAGISPMSAPDESNDFGLAAAGSCQPYGPDFAEKIVFEDIPDDYDVYFCAGDVHYGGGYYVHYQYTGGIPGTGTKGSIDSWYGPFAPNILAGGLD